MIQLCSFCQVTVSTSNYIGQIEMGRRIPSFEKIEKIAAALGVSSHELFAYETAEKKDDKKLKTKDILKKMPAQVKKELISHLVEVIKKDIIASLNP